MATFFHRLTYLLSSLPLFWIAWQLFQVWTRPAVLPDAASWVRFGVGLMILEFVLLHSGVMGIFVFTAAETWWKRVLAGLGIVLFYGAFAWGLSMGTDSRQILSIYGFVLLGRAVTVLVDGAKGAAAIMGRSLLGTLVYLPMVFASVLLPWPRFGLVGEFAAAARSPNTSGIWVDEPHRAIGAGMLYFLCMAALEIWLAFQDPEKNGKSGHRQ